MDTSGQFLAATSAVLSQAASDLNSSLRGTINVLKQSIRAIEALSQAYPDKTARRIVFILGGYAAAASYFLEVRTSENLRKALTVTDEVDPAGLGTLDVGTRLRWIAFDFANFVDLFGDRTEDLHYRRAQAKLVPDYMDEDTFVLFVRVLEDAFRKASKQLRDATVAFFGRLADAMKGDNAAEDAVFLIVDEAVALGEQSTASPS